MILTVWSCSVSRALLFLTASLALSNCLDKEPLSGDIDCYYRMCWCWDYTADCSNNGKRLQFVPAFLSTIYRLHFAFNGLSHLPPDFFANVTQLTFVNLTGNEMDSIDEDAFRGLKNLREVVLDRNFLNFVSVRPVLNIHSLTVLHFSFNRNITWIPDGIFTEFPLPNLLVLNIEGSNLNVLNLTVFKPLTRLIDLNVNDSRVQRLETDTLVSLRYLRLDANRISGDFPATCFETNRSHFPMLRSLSLRHNVISRIDTPVCLPHLAFLSLNGNQLRILKSEVFLKFPRLESLNLVQMDTSITYIDPYAFKNPTLRNVYLSYNYISFSKDSFSSMMFRGCSKLEMIQLDNNDFSGVTDQKFQELFQDLPKLKLVYLGKSSIKTITSKTFQTLSNITVLKLYSNVIEDLPDGVFDIFVNLKNLSLDDNRISIIRPTMFSPSTRQRLRELDLSGNPFACTCDVLWFRDWLMADSNKFVNFPRGYACASFASSNIESLDQKEVGTTCAEVSEDVEINAIPHRHAQSRSHRSIISPGSISSRRPEGKEYDPTAKQHVSFPPQLSVVYLKDFILSDQACLLNQATSLLTAVVAGVLVVFLLSFVVLYKYRWHIRLALYEAFRGKLRQEDNREYEYDLFVSYASEDVGWVRDELIPTLEVRHRLRLCIHQRDFPVGGNIIDNITACVQSSKRVMFVLSPHFATSRWCQFELLFCQNYAMERDDVIVLALLTPIPVRDVTDAMSALLKTTTYVEWGEQPDARKAFWGRLLLAFQDILPQQPA